MPLLSIALGLAQFAPIVAGWLGGSKAEDVATKVVGVAEAVTGKTGADALSAIQGDPNLAAQFQQKVLEQQTALAQLAAEEQKEILDANVQEGKIAADDRDSARKMQISQPSWVPAILTCALTLMMAAVIGFDLYLFSQGKDIPDNQIIGALLVQWGAALGYWFGTTRQVHNLQNSLAQSTPSK